ncbi:MAG: metallophosphoesterase family protein [Bacilli bacterium]|nr:metallophosphoesterase family protein [Bacilli bacterium]
MKSIISELVINNGLIFVDSKIEDYYNLNPEETVKIVNEIISKKDNKFIDFYKKLLFLKNKVINIPFFTSLIKFYSNYNNLVDEIIDKEDFNQKDIMIILKLFKMETIIPVFTLSEVFRKEDILDKRIKSAIDSKDITAKELKEIFIKQFTGKTFQEFGNILSYGINTKILEKILLKKDNMSNEDYNKVSNLNIFMTFITEVYALEDKERLKDILKLIDTREKRDNYLEIFNYFSDISEKIREVYEIDANVTLTNLSELPDYLYNKNDDYYDLSNSEYGLYMHSTEFKNLEGLVNYKYNGRSYICLSGISDKMRKGNYQGGIIVLYDYIPKGNFIGSSPFNIGSNGKIGYNLFDFSKINYIQMEFKDNTSYRFADESDNSETNIYREGLIPSGVLVQGDKPSIEEIRAAEKLRRLTNKKIPLIKVQDKYQKIENPKKIEYLDKFDINKNNRVNSLKEQLDQLKRYIENEKKSSQKKKIGILTDIHGLDVPLKASLEDMKNKGITEIYSLGDNLEDGPNPKEVMRLLEEYGVISLAGNAEEYITLGTEPFHYLSLDRIENNNWTQSQITENEMKKIAKYPHSIDLVFGGKKVGLCHFASDVRTDYDGVWKYQRNINKGSAYFQFLETNNGKENKEINAAYKSRDRDPLFNGKKVDLYDLIIQGHTHFKIREKSPSTEFYTLRANGMGYKNDPDNSASYIILEETDDGYKINEILVQFDRIKLAESVVQSELPDKSKIIKFTGLTEEELKIAQENLCLGDKNGRK